VFIPVYDKGEEKLKFPAITLLLIAVNISIFVGTDLYQIYSGSMALQSELAFYACHSETRGCDFFDIFLLNDIWAFFTYQFVHEDILHLGFNLLFLWVFGDNVEHYLPPHWFLALFLACGLFGAILFAVVNADDGGALIGASGSISGIMAAYLVLWPKQHVRVLAWFGFLVFPFRIPAWLIIAFWMAKDFYYLTIELDYVTDVAFSAHVGGALTGLLAGGLIFLISNRSRNDNAK
jgi:membrane associated rhomboid family serine protease